MEEIWKIIPIADRYMISNRGTIKPIHDDVRKLILRHQLTRKGYLRIRIRTNEKWDTFRVHRLVALTFIDNPENKPEVNHKNGIKTDNRVDNLEWSTSSENKIHAVKTGLYKSIIKPLVQYKDGSVIREYNSSIEVEKFGFKSSSVRSCLSGRRKQYMGFQWEYK